MSGIEVLPMQEAVRRRPALWCQPPTATGLLGQTVAAMRSPEVEAALRVCLGARGSFTVEAAGVLLPIHDRLFGGVMQPAVLPLLLSLFTPGPTGLAGLLPVVSSLSSFFRLTLRDGAVELTAETARGALVAPISRRERSGGAVTRLEVVPDPLVLACDLGPEWRPPEAMAGGVVWERTDGHPLWCRIEPSSMSSSRATRRV